MTPDVTTHACGGAPAMGLERNTHNNNNNKIIIIRGANNNKKQSTLKCV